LIDNENIKFTDLYYGYEFQDNFFDVTKTIYSKNIGHTLKIIWSYNIPLNIKLNIDLSNFEMDKTRFILDKNKDDIETEFYFTIINIDK